MVHSNRLPRTRPATTPGWPHLVSLLGELLPEPQRLGGGALASLDHLLQVDGPLKQLQAYLGGLCSRMPPDLVGFAHHPSPRHAVRGCVGVRNGRGLIHDVDVDSGPVIA